jgi:molecular chaperone GrpE
MQRNKQHIPPDANPDTRRPVPEDDRPAGAGPDFLDPWADPLKNPLGHWAREGEPSSDDSQWRHGPFEEIPHDTPNPDAGQNSPSATPDAAASQPDHEELQAELADMRLRAAAEMENFKKRLAREHQEQLRYAAENVLGDLLPTLDNLDLALQYGASHEACRDMLQGVAMTRKLLLEAVGKHGLAPFGEEGEKFTPEHHEAVGFDKRTDLGAGTVARVLQRGYKLGDRLLRPAKVMINQ